VHELSASAILAVWERGQGASPGERALQLLAAAGQAEDVSVGERDARLLDARVRTFGPLLAAVADCPACGERLDVELSAGDLAGSAPPAPAELAVEVGGRAVRVRVPTASDLAAVAAARDVESGRAELLRRCLIDREAVGTRAARAIAAALAEADPGARIDVALACPTCLHEWEIPFDIVSFLWAEIDACARRLLGEVHALARAYGWREADVLALSPRRRAAYLELAGA
jgi:hypothetical protein